MYYTKIIIETNKHKFVVSFFIITLKTFQNDSLKSFDYYIDKL